MSAKIFLDTNILVYAFDCSAPGKQERALEIVKARARGEWQISWQVVQEFCAVALHRFSQPMAPSDLRQFLTTVLWPACRVLPSQELHLHALALHDETQFRYYDCLIVAAAIASGAQELYTEDLQNRRTIGGVRIVNPFHPAD